MNIVPLIFSVTGLCTVQTNFGNTFQRLWCEVGALEVMLMIWQWLSNTASLHRVSLHKANLYLTQKTRVSLSFIWLCYWIPDPSINEHQQVLWHSFQLWLLSMFSPVFLWACLQCGKKSWKIVTVLTLCHNVINLKYLMRDSCWLCQPLMKVN